MKVLVTGATGYFGQRLIPAILANDSTTEILTINRNAEKAQQLFAQKQCTHIDKNDTAKIVEFNPQIVIHLATLSTSRNDSEIIAPMLEANIEFGVKLLSTLTQCKALKLFVNLGSFAEYRLGGNEIHDAYLYTATKSAFRKFVAYYSELAGFKYITAVPYTVYGGHDTAKKIIDYICDSLDAAEPVKMSGGEQMLDFVHIDDVVNFFVCAINSMNKILQMPNGQEFCLGTGIGTTIREVARIAERISGKTCNAAWGALPYRQMDVMHAVAPKKENMNKIGWSAKISIEEGVREKLGVK